MLIIAIVDTHTGLSSTAEIPSEFAHSFRSAIAERREQLGSKATGAYQYEREDAITRAVAAMGTFAAALNTTVPKEDPDYA